MIRVMKNSIRGWVAVFSICLGFVYGPAYSADMGGSISGKVAISKELQSKVGPNAALFIIARPNGMTAGPPSAVKRIAAPITFPVSFELSGKDGMMSGGVLSGEFTLTARVSQSGSASPAGAGDLLASQPLNGVKPGGKPVVLTIDQEKK